MDDFFNDLRTAFRQDFPGEVVRYETHYLQEDVPGYGHAGEAYYVVSLVSHPSGIPLNIAAFPSRSDGIRVAVHTARHCWDAGPPA